SPLVVSSDATQGPAVGARNPRPPHQALACGLRGSGQRGGERLRAADAGRRVWAPAGEDSQDAPPSQQTEPGERSPALGVAVGKRPGACKKVAERAMIASRSARPRAGGRAARRQPCCTLAPALLRPVGPEQVAHITLFAPVNLTEALTVIIGLRNTRSTVPVRWTEWTDRSPRRFHLF